MSAMAQPPTVLFADDEPSIRKLFAATLEGSGIHLLEAADGVQALALAHEARPQLVVLDIAMPGMDGIEVCRALKADDRTRHIPVWILSAYARAGEDRLRDAPADARIEKPFSPLALRTRIEQALRSSIGGA